MLTKVPRGTKDVLPSESYKWHYVEKIAKDVAECFGFQEIRTPVFEHTELFERGIGETTDVVEKEMYTFEDRGKRSVTLKPEGTAPVVRSFIENKLYADAQPTKLYYITPVFRYERPQAGRYRQHHQFGIEVFGASNASIDAEVIHVAMTIYQKLGLEKLEVRINSIGCPQCKEHYNEVLKTYLSNRIDNLCGTCQSRYERNPMRIIDCKVESCQEQLTDVPLMIDYICDECRDHFEGVQNHLEAIGVPFTIDPKIVRGLDYYSKTAFEIITDEAGKKGTLCGGGRYDQLVEQCGGPATPGVGFGMGLERAILALETQGIVIPKPEGLDIFLVTMGEKAELQGFKILSELRQMGLRADQDHLSRSTKAQFKYANKLMAQYTAIIGDEELERGTVSLKNMETGEQSEISIDKIVDILRDKL
ncbi:histidyl-tRNA synthetase [Alkaliphilus metalliredigens QYMF]|uniref:Histidine--tRNA ligase n=1 Tax=Alkaliphilus metalliredigens (strain QYMF) TaxID=293826 RepID=A6TQP4_ALKMQ|nr:histidine--tRNA ligase [Alkaliphilus metalliredigens]ABR48512.1 histidyl-tRNA synthetase [Alkaliphilus metalliredigens QYMF]